MALEANLKSELEAIKAEMKKANLTINALQEREKQMKVRYDDGISPPDGALSFPSAPDDIASYCLTGFWVGNVSTKLLPRKLLPRCRENNGN